MPDIQDHKQPACEILLLSLQQADDACTNSMDQKILLLFDLELRCFLQQQLAVFNKPAISIKQNEPYSLNQPLNNLLL